VSEPTVLEFAGGATDQVLAHMGELRAAGRGWINITPADLEPPEPPGLWARMNARGSTGPRITWTAPRAGRSRTSPAEVGIEHPTANRALGRLGDVGHPLPPGWVRTQDHATRGVVVVPAVDASDADVLGWALGAMTALVGTPTGGLWRAQVYAGA
jgi:hypothetical protein